MDKCALVCARIFAGIAQLVEQLICNQQVVGSNPTAGSIVNRESASNDERLLGHFFGSRASKSVAEPSFLVARVFYRRTWCIRVPRSPIQLDLTTRNGNTKAVEGIGFETDVAGFLDEVVHWTSRCC